MYVFTCGIPVRGDRRDFASTFRRHGEGTDAPSHTRPSQAGAFYESALGGSLLAQLSRNMRRAWLRPRSAGISGSVAVMLAELLGRAHASGFWRRQSTFARVAGEGPTALQESTQAAVETQSSGRPPSPLPRRAEGLRVMSPIASPAGTDAGAPCVPASDTYLPRPPSGTGDTATSPSFRATGRSRGVTTPG